MIASPVFASATCPLMGVADAWVNMMAKAITVAIL